MKIKNNGRYTDLVSPVQLESVRAIWMRLYECGLTANRGRRTEHELMLVIVSSVTTLQ